MGDGEPKQFRDLGGKPLFEHSLESFSSISEIDEIVVVLPANSLSEYLYLKDRYKRLDVTSGGVERWQSVRNGFRCLNDKVTCILIHDVARPFVPASVIRNCIESVRAGRDTITALPAVNTIKSIEENRIVQTLDRRRLIEVQTPQAFTRETLEEVYTRTGRNGRNCPGFLKTDEAGMAELSDLPVTWIKGSTVSHKVTNEEDFKWAEWMLSRIQRGEINLND
jgi:2-C-methyl-D-erythritol 4-phosphate cytidylyltransferase